MKHILLPFVILLTAALLAGCTSDPAGPVTGGTGTATAPGDNPSPAFDNTDYRYSVADGQATLVAYDGEGGSVTVPSSVDGYPVVAIGPMAFAYCETVTSVTVPGTVASTGYMAFLGCTALESVTLGEGVLEVGVGSFNGCTSLAEVSLPDSLRTVGMGAFKGCRRLKTVDLKNVETLCDSAFCDTGLETVTVPASVTKAGEFLFSQCEALTSVTWAAPAYIDENAFSFDYALWDVSITGTPSRIYHSAFRRCYSLKEIVIPASVNRFYPDAFYGCTALEKITIENPYFYRMYSQCFHWVPSLKDVYYAGGEEQWKAILNDGENEALDGATIHFAW